MATLTGNSVGSSYLGLLKTTDNAAITGSLKNMTDGAGNATPLSMANNYVQLQAPVIELIESTGGTNLITIDATQTLFEGAVDFTNATVTGIGGGSPGLVAGSIAGSMKSAAALNTNPAQSDSDGNVALGDNARALGGGGFTRTNIAIGTSTLASNERCIAIGHFASATGTRDIALGEEATGAGGRAIAIGQKTSATAFGTITIGNYCTASSTHGIRIGGSGPSVGTESISIGYNPSNQSQNKSVSIGYQTVQSALHGINIGSNSRASGSWAVGIGLDAEARGEQATAIGPKANVGAQSLSTAVGYDATTSAESATAIGDRSRATLIGSVALGASVTSVWAQGTTVNQLAFANVANLNFADQTAAVAGGVPTGGLYHTDGTVKIVY